MPKSKRWEITLLFGLVLWVFIVLGGYYYYHKPINAVMLAAPALGLLDIFIIILFAGLAGGIGRRLLQAGEIPVLERSALQFALGLGMIGFAWLAAGLLSLYRYPLAVLVLLAGVILLRRDVLGWFSGYGAMKYAWQHAARLEKLLAAATAILLLYQLFVALAPPVKWDALTYHLQLPRLYINEGRFFFTPDNPYWGHPQLVEMLYTFAMSTHRAETAALLGWSAGVIFLAGLYGFTNTQLSRLRGAPVSGTAGWIAVTGVVAGATFRYLLGWSYADLFSALFGLAALAAFFECIAWRSAGWFLWAAVFCGLALGTKWTAGVLVLGIFGAALLYRRQAGISFKTVLAGGGIVLLMVLPWLGKNLLFTGSPLYPYFFGTAYYDATRTAAFNQAPAAVDGWMHILAPFTITWAGLDTMAGFSTDIGPLLLLFAVPGLVVYRGDLRTRTAAILLAICLAAIAIGGLRYEYLLQTRLYYAALPAFAAACGWGWDWLQSQVLQQVRLRRIFSAVILLVIALVFWQESYDTARLAPAGVFLGTQSRQQYLENTIGYTIIAMQKLETLPQDARILMLWEPRGLYAPLNARPDLWIDRWQTDRRAYGSAEAVLQHWKNEGYTHLLVLQKGLELIQPSEGQAPSENWLAFQDLPGLLPPPDPVGDLYLLYTLP